MFSHGITLLIMVEVFEQSKFKNNVISTLLLSAYCLLSSQCQLYCHGRLPVKLTKQGAKPHL